ncbi:carboxymuconolactone decarboxylase family protein [Arthrobacter sp. MSA 4-2]|uniref:carboxymuconolactone decarboxylase family protein n=1 Tax=Arthrobacter sp. MSA 4-2 TaxID=2794349 RepID=UPI0018E8466F|nr:carboxymuconolactone decarboxylase family protein [Arthrobacter sp. MSA 4-2]MBJ2121476.1 carboxymuconolactone decarboxylase family protein [Arthrobacter sp. MSA 4-2]
MTHPNRINSLAPSAYDALLVLSQESEEFAERAGLSPGVAELVKIRASQINGCAFCLRMHSKQAREQGETPDRLAVLSAWRETEYFTPEERAALSLTEKTTLIATAGSPYEHEREQMVLSNDQIAAVQWIVIAINAFNRVAVISEFDVKP